MKFGKGLEAKVSGPFRFLGGDCSRDGRKGREGGLVIGDWGSVIGEGIAHANPTTLLTRFAGGAPKGSRGGRGRGNFEIRNADIGECEGENVGMWCWGVGFERRRPRRCRRYLGFVVAIR